MSNFCSLPWKHILVACDGQIYPCANTYDYAKNNMGDALNGEYSSAINHELIRSMRLDFLNDQRPAVCDKCFKQEEFLDGTNSASLRVVHNDYFSDFGPSEAQAITQPDGTVSESDFHLEYLYLQPSNVCEFSCRTCSPAYSTGWNKDADLLGPLLGGYYHSCKKQTLKGITDNIPFDKVTLLQFDGGEPLIEDEHYNVLDYLISQGYNSNIFLTYNTNLSVLSHLDWDAINLWKQFKRVFIRGSIDASYERAEYLRKGCSWEKIIANREKLLNDFPECSFKLFSTVSVFNVWHLPDLINEWLNLGYIPVSNTGNFPGFVHFVLLDPPWLKMQILPTFKKDEIRAHYDSFSFPPMIKAQLDVIIQKLYSEDLYDEQYSKFIENTTTIDEIRGEDYKATFPELDF